MAVKRGTHTGEGLWPFRLLIAEQRVRSEGMALTFSTKQTLEAFGKVFLIVKESIKILDVESARGQMEPTEDEAE